MIALVVVDGPPPRAPQVCGLAVPLRALLALQAAGAATLGFVGDDASAWQTIALTDDRVQRPVEVFSTTPTDDHVTVAGHVVIDTRFARGLLATPGVVRVDGLAVAAHRVAGHSDEPLTLDGVAVPVTDAASAGRAEALLLAGLCKPQDGIISRAINRRISLRVTRLLAPTGLRPNQLSVGILAFGVAGAVLAAQGSPGAMALGGLCFNAQSILDGCDGELARLTFRGSRTGEWIDTVGDDFTNYGFFAGATLGLHRAGLGAAPVVAGVLGVGAGVVASLIEYRYLVRIGSGDLLKYPLGFGNDGDATKEPDTGVRRLLGLARPFFKRDFFVFATMLATFAGLRATLAMLCAFAVGAWITLVAVLRSEWSRR